MGSNSAAEWNAWLRAGDLLVAASDRAARAITNSYHRAQHEIGLKAWASPHIVDWKTFVRTAWDERRTDSRLLLNPLQEQALWSDIIAASGYTAGLLQGPRRRLADLAMEARELLCLYAPRFLRKELRTSWQQDAGVFSTWLEAFDTRCRQLDVVSVSSLPLELVPNLEKETSSRPSLLLAGFDRMMPTQRRLLETWRHWRELPLGEQAKSINYYVAPDQQKEIEACAEWCRQRLQLKPDSRLLVIAPDAGKNRGEIERAFLAAGADSSLHFEFSLGIPLRRVPLANSAYALLRWLDSSLQEPEVDWLLSSSYLARDARESSGLQLYMRTLRRRSLARTEWSLHSFLQHQSGTARLPLSWTDRMAAAQTQLRLGHILSPLEWAAVVPKVLQTAGWPGKQDLSSPEFQALTRWHQTLDTCATLAFDGRRIEFRDFLAELGHLLGETLFTPESEDPPILVAGPAESAGLSADAIWFLGADEDAWPAGGSTHPFLPSDLQRGQSMPHATAQLDWDFAQSTTTRLLRSAGEVHFSYAHQKESAEARPSRLIQQHHPAVHPIPQDLRIHQPAAPVAIASLDISAIPFPQVNTTEDHQGIQVRGGSTVLTSQSQCPFKAFATARLDAQSWRPAEAGLSAALRGQLLHTVLHAIWAGAPHGIHTLDDLLSIEDLPSFVAKHVHAAFDEGLPSGVREQMPPRYLQLEERRLTALLAEWLRYEAGRQPFSVHQTEVDALVNVAGLSLKLRLDRVDRLSDDTLLVVDYKTGDVSPKSWELPRPEDVQLPLYAGFALAPDQELGGLAFAKIRAGDTCFAGRVGDPVGTLRADLKGNSNLARNPLTVEQLMAWRDYIEQLARDFLAGRAVVDPREYPQTCDHCGLYTLCRIQERESPGTGDEELAEVSHD